MPGDGDPESKRRALNWDIDHLDKLGWDIRNLAPAGEDGLYRLYARDNRLRVHLTPAQRGQACAPPLPPGDRTSQGTSTMTLVRPNPRPNTPARS